MDRRQAPFIAPAAPLALSPDVSPISIGGASAAPPRSPPTITCMHGNARSGFAMIGGWLRYFRERNDTLIARTAADIERAKQEGRLALLLHCQGTAIIEDELDLLDACQAAGLRIVQLCYNRKNLVGDGAGERTDSDLIYFGPKLIERLNTLGMIIDCSYTGHRTSMDAADNSADPVIISHANARTVHDNARNIDDELIRAVAARGAVIGTVGFPYFLTADGQPSLDRFIDDIEHVGIGIDYYEGQHPVEDNKIAKARYDQRIANGSWRPEEHPPPPIQISRRHRNAREPAPPHRAAVRARFHRGPRAQGLGLNWLRVYRQIWG